MLNRGFLRSVLGLDAPMPIVGNPQAAAFARQAAQALKDDPTVDDSIAGLFGAIGEDLAFDGGGFSGSVMDGKPEHRQPIKEFYKEGAVILNGAGAGVLTELIAAAGVGDVAPFTAASASRVLASGTDDDAVLANHAIRAILPFVEVTMSGGTFDDRAGDSLAEWLMRQLKLTIKYDDGIADFAIYRASFASLAEGYKLAPRPYQLSLVNKQDFQITFDYPGVGEQADETLIDLRNQAIALYECHVRVGVLVSLDPFDVYAARCKASGLNPRNPGSL